MRKDLFKDYGNFPFRQPRMIKLVNITLTFNFGED